MAKPYPVHGLKGVDAGRSPKLKRPVIDASLYRQQGRFLTVYDQLLTVKTPYVVNFGGGGSGKSFAQSLFFVRRLLNKKHKLLVLRRFGSTLDDSVIDQFLEFALPFWGCREDVHYSYNKTRRRIRFANGSQISFRGLDNAEKLKSISGITLVWVEEATELAEGEFKVMSDRIRGEPQIYLTYNPISERHWLRKRFHHADDPHKGIDGRVSVIFSTYLDNPFIGQKYIDDMAWYRDNDPDHYAIYALGKFGIIRPDNPFFTLWKPRLFVGKTTYDPTTPVHVSCDFNIKHSFLISQHKGDSISYLEAWHGEGELEAMCKKLAQKYGRNLIYFTGDASGNNRNALTSGNLSAWALIKGYMKTYGAKYCKFEQVPTSNLGLGTSRMQCNALMAYFGRHIQIDPEGCGLLIDDIERMRATSDGSLDKVHANKHNYGHVGDCFRYDLSNFEQTTFARLEKLPALPE